MVETQVPTGSVTLSVFVSYEGLRFRFDPQPLSPTEKGRSFYKQILTR